MAEEPPEDGGYEFREQADASTLRSRGHLQLSLGGKEDVDGEEYVDGKEDVDSGELQLVRRLGWSPYSKLPIKIVSNDDGTTQELPLGKYYEGTLSDQHIQCLMITKRNFPLLERELWFQKVLHDLREISQSGHDTSDSVSISDNILLTKHLLIAEDVSGNKPGYFICYCPFSVTLSNHIRNLDRSAILSIFSGICNGLVYLHSEHIVHCALTPSSIALAQHPTDRNLFVPKIMNFSRTRLLENRDRFGIIGLVKSHFYNMVAAVTPVGLLSTPNMAATPFPSRSSPAFFPGSRKIDNNSWILDASVSPYMSPEAMKDSFTEAHDIYSLGCIIYETLTGRTPQHCNLNFYDLDGMDYDMNFGTIVSSCTEHEREKRMTAQEVIEELKNMPILCKEERHSNSEQDDGLDSMSDTEGFCTPQGSLDPNETGTAGRSPLFHMRSKVSFILPFQEPLKSSFKNEWSPSQYIDVQLFPETSLSGFGVSFDLKNVKDKYVWYVPGDETSSSCFLWQEFPVEENPQYKDMLNRRRHQLLINHPNLAKCLGITVQLINDSEWIGVYEECTSCSLEHFIHNHWQGEFTKEQKIWLITSITKQLLQLVCDLQRKGVCVAAQVQNSINSKNVRLRISSNYEDSEPNCCSQNAFIYHHVKFSLVSLEDDVRYRPPEYPKEHHNSSDLWSIFCVTVFMLSEKHPWDNGQKQPLNYGTEMYEGNLDFASLVNLVAINRDWGQYLYRDAVLKLLDKVFKVQPVDRPTARNILTNNFTTCSDTGMHEYIRISSPHQKERHFVEHIQVTLGGASQCTLSNHFAVFKEGSKPSLPRTEEEKWGLKWYKIVTITGIQIYVPANLLKLLHGVKVRLSVAVAVFDSHHYKDWPSESVVTPIVHFDWPLGSLNERLNFRCILPSYGNGCKKCIISPSMLCKAQDKWMKENMLFLDLNDVMSGKLTFHFRQCSTMAGIVSTTQCSMCHYFQVNVVLMQEKENPSKVLLSAYIDHGVWQKILQNHYPTDVYHVIGRLHTHSTFPKKWQSIAIDTYESRNLHCSERKKIDFSSLVNTNHSFLVDACRKGSYPLTIDLTITDTTIKSVIHIVVVPTADGEGRHIEFRIQPSLPANNCNRQVSAPSRIPNASHPYISLEDKPLQKDLDKISKKAGDDWRTLLTQLGLDEGTIEQFYLNKIGNISEACFKGLAHWVGGNADKPVTWEKLLKAMRDSSMVGFADDWEKEIRDQCNSVHKSLSDKRSESI